MKQIIKVTLDSAPQWRHLWQVQRPPKELFIHGEQEAFALIDKLPTRGLAVVGTRRPQPRSLAHVRTVINSLKDSGLIIISGLARGIDAEAHKAALNTGLPTIAVVAAGLDVVYPREHENLQKEIIEKGGLIVSEHPPGTLPLPAFFIERNRFIACWSNAVWVAEAPARSGALSTARWARDQNITCYATPCFPGDPALSGNEWLIDDASALPLWDAHSLGTTWLELACLPTTARRRKTEKTAGNDDKTRLSNKIRSMTAERGAVDAPTLFDWALSQGWSPRRFFSTLRNCQSTNLRLDY
jgi:DNA protecting protein DprA